MIQEPDDLAAATQPLPLDRLASALRDALCGPAHLGAPVVVWSDGDARLQLHVGKLQVRTAGTALVVAVDTECEEYAVTSLMVRFVFGTENDPASLVAATDEDAFGHPRVAARWGGLFRDVVWAALTRLVDVASGAGSPAGITVGEQELRLIVRTPFSPVDLAVAHARDLVERGLRPRPGRPFGAWGRP